MLDLPLTKISETATTITLGWTPPPGVEWYTLFENHKRVSNHAPIDKHGVVYQQAEFSKALLPLGVVAEVQTSAGVFDMAVGSYPSTVTPPSSVIAPAWTVKNLLNQTSEGAHTGAWVKSARPSPSNPDPAWAVQGMIEFADFPNEYVMVEAKRFVSGYPGRTSNFHLVGGDNAHRGVSPLSLDYHPGRSDDWPPDIVPGVVLTCQAELDDHRRGHWQVLTDAEAAGGEFTFVWRNGWRQNTSGWCNLQVFRIDRLFRTIIVPGIKTAYAEQQPRLYTWLGSYESNGDQASTILQTLDHRGRTLPEALAEKPVFGSIWHTSGPSGDSSAALTGTLPLGAA